MATGQITVVEASALANSAQRQHAVHMRRAIAQARRNPAHPFGAVIVDALSDTIMGEGVNRVDVSPILHGETAAIDACARNHPTVDWRRLTLYTTAEPCPMCAGAIAWAGISEIVIGTSIATMAGLGFKQLSLPCLTVFQSAPFYQARVIADFLTEETDPLYAPLAAGGG